jgi:hypothetical protein
MTTALPDYHLLRPNAVAHSNAPESERAAGILQVADGIVFSHEKTTSANLSQPARAYLSSMTSADPDTDEDLSRALWRHALAIIYAPSYLPQGTRPRNPGGLAPRAAAGHA